MTTISAPDCISQTLMELLINTSDNSIFNITYSDGSAGTITGFNYQNIYYVPVFDSNSNILCGVKYTASTTSTNINDVLAQATLTDNSNAPISIWNYDKSYYNNKYAYVLGIDSITISNESINTNCCNVCKTIDLGTIDSNTYIQLSADYFTDENSSIEFYIVDCGKEYPIMPLEDKLITNEKVFYGLSTRFAIDNNFNTTIKKDGNINTSININQLTTINDGSTYTIDYTPLNAYSHYVLNSTISIKVIMRLYNTQSSTPYISKLEIRKYGGNTLWTATI